MAETMVKTPLSFLFWGIRFYNVALFLGFPLLGALFSLEEITSSNFSRLMLFAIFNFLFLIYVFLYNDWGDAILNAEEPSARQRQALKYPNLISERIVLGLCIGLALLSVLGVHYLSFISGILLMMVLIISYLYSNPKFTLKRYIFGPELAHFLGGAFYFLSGWVLFQPISDSAIHLSIFFGAVLTAGNFANQIEHFDQELNIRLKTSAICFGKRPVYRLSLWLFIFSSIYLLVLAWQELVPSWLIFPAIFLSLSWGIVILYSAKLKLFENISGLRRIIRIIYSVFSLILIIKLVLEKL